MRQEATVKLHTSQILSANHRMHWRVEAQKKATLVDFGRLVLAPALKPMTERVRVSFEFRFPSSRRRDRANLHPTVKAALDGIVRAGVLVDDSDDHIDGPDITIMPELSGQPGFVLVTVVLEDARSARNRWLAEANAQILRERDEVAREKELRLAADRWRR